MGSLQRTPLHAFHATRGARLVEFAGWEMPLQYRSILDEHRAVRTAAGLFDVSHMGEIVVRGRGAAELIDSLVTNDVVRMAGGRALYTPMCNRFGGVIDDLIVYKRGEADFLLCVNAINTARDLEWISARAAGAECTVTDETLKWGLLAVQGPLAERALQPLTEVPLAGIAYYHFVAGAVASVSCLVSRTGYTGEAGFEIFCPWDDAERLAVAIEASGSAHGLIPCGLGARDSLRLEAGFPLYGHEITEEISPIQAGLGWTVKLDKPAFIGREALMSERAEGPAHRVVFFRTGDRRIVRPESPVYFGDRVVGRVLSGTMSPMLNEAIGSALVDTDRTGEGLEADIRGQRLRLQLVKPPFVPLKRQKAIEP